MLLFFFISFLHAHVLVVEQKPDFIQQAQILNCVKESEFVGCLASLQGVLSVDFYPSAQVSSLVIKPRKPIARWGAGFVDSSGQWFQVPLTDDNRGLTVLDVKEPDLYDAIVLLSRFTTRHMQLTYVEKTAGGQWQVLIQDGPLLYLGSRPSDPMGGVEQFFKSHPDALRLAGQYFDFRNPEMVARGRR
jgi:hypothetical protein